MSFNELNAVEYFIIQKLSGKNLNAAGSTSLVQSEQFSIKSSKFNKILLNLTFFL